MHLTIIVPIYNYARFLPKLLNSIFKQKKYLQKIMILIIDDGSTDEIGVVVEEYTKQFPKNIVYYRKKNGNWGSVINYAVQNHLVKTPYVTICDADDWYLPNAFEKVWKFLDNETDLVITNFLKKRRFYIVPVLTYLTLKRTINSNSLQKQTPFCVPLGKFIKTSVFNNLSLLEENVAYQDAIFTAEIINLSKNIVYVKSFIGTYNYANTVNSMSRPWNQERYHAEIGVVQQLIQHDCQEIAVTHLLRQKFRVLVKKNNIKFAVNRAFNFIFIPIWLRWIFVLVYWCLLKRYFKFSLPPKK